MGQEPKDRLKQARIDAGYDTAADFAEALREAGKAVTTEAYRHHENGTRTIRPPVAELYAPLLKVSPQYLLFGDNSSAKPRVNNSVRVQGRSLPSDVNATSFDKIEVLGMAECGPDGWALWNGEVVDRIDRPPQLAGAPKGYAVFVVGVSMEPRYHPGEVAYIHPGKPPQPGSYVLVQMHPLEDGVAPRAFLKRLVKRSGDKVILEQCNPKKTFTLKASEVLSMHRVVGSGEQP